MLWASTPWLDIMAAPRRVIDISIEADDLMQLDRIARSRTEPASWVERARILLAYRADLSAHAVGEMVGVTHQTVLRCLRRTVRFGVMAALDDSPRPGKAPEMPVPDCYRWPARKPKTWDIRTNSGRPGYWRVMCVSTRWKLDILAWPAWYKRRSARVSPPLTSNHTRCATIWNGVTKHSRRK